MAEELGPGECVIEGRKRNRVEGHPRSGRGTVNPARELRLATSAFTDQQEWNISVFGEANCPLMEATARQRMTEGSGCLEHRAASRCRR
jgi:hypothetical protein